MSSGGTLRQPLGNSRRGAIVEFTGAPGSGKSTLASHTLARAEERGVAVVEGREILPVYLENGPMAWLVRNLLPFAAKAEADAYGRRTATKTRAWTVADSNAGYSGSGSYSKAKAKGVWCGACNSPD